MRMPPLDLIASWPTPNYVDPVMRGPANIIITLIFFPLVFLIVGVRIYTRLRISRSFGADDWLILLCLLPTTGFVTISLVTELHYGWNRHIWDVPVNELTLGLKFALISEILFALSTDLTKLSMLILTYRVLVTGPSVLSKAIKATFALIVLAGTSFCFVILFQCGKPSRYWTLSFAPQPQCISESKALLAAGLVNTVLDLIVVVIPIPTIRRLHLPYRQQILLILLFSAGFAITLAGAVRTYYIWKVTTVWDKTWEIYPAWISSSVELYVGIICASIPPTGKFFGLLIAKIFGISPTMHNSMSSRATPISRSNEVGFEIKPLPANGSENKHRSLYDEFPLPPKSPGYDTDTISSVTMSLVDEATLSTSRLNQADGTSPLSAVATSTPESGWPPKQRQVSE